MRVCNLASGSKGNCTYIESDSTRLLIDIGMTAKYVVDNLTELNVLPETIDAILITHEHSDHVKGVLAFVKKYNTRILCAEVLKDVLTTQLIGCEDLIATYSGEFELGDLKIIPFPVSHDSVACFGYKVIDGDASVSLATDLGYCPDNVFKMIKSSTVVFLEANYDPEMLFACNYPPFLKKRIMGNCGHLSNKECALVAEKLAYSGTRQIVLSHISENSNTQFLAYTTIKNYLESKGIVIDKNIRLDVANQNCRGTIYKIRKNV
ncbi:MAG: MBL fold metallo-hydrolase [Clostridia bacterium]|nr:MBL fold metallo-hydrolase [Clostridia bacterium]